MSGIPLRAAAKQLRLHRSTLSKWIKQGAPVLEEGTDGRGHSAIVDLDALLRWRAKKFAPGLAQRADDDLLKIFETALLDSLKRDELAKRARITEAQAALAVLIVFERIYRNVKQQPLTPQHVPAQMRKLCTDLLLSIERGNFERSNGGRT